MSQTARPSSDISNAGLWVQSTGASLFGVLDETSVADADYISSPGTPVNAICEVKLSALVDPVSSTGHIVRYRYAQTSVMIVGAATADVEDLVVKLVQGTTVLKTWTHTVVQAKATATQTLSAGEADSITDYSDLRLRFQANETFNDGVNGVSISWAEMQVSSLGSGGGSGTGSRRSIEVGVGVGL